MLMMQRLVVQRVRMIIAVCMVMMWGVSCNEIEGTLQVLRSFVLTDDDGHRLEIRAGTHDADFSYDKSKSEVELEIDNLVDDEDRDFEFHIPNMSDLEFDKNGEIEVWVSGEDNRQGVDLDTYIVKDVDNIGTYKTGFGNYCTHPRSRYTRGFVVYDVWRTEVEVELEIISNEEPLANFDARYCKLQGVEQYCVDCFGYIDYGCYYRPYQYCN